MTCTLGVVGFDVETAVHVGRVGRTREATMDDHVLRTFIQQRLMTGLLPTGRVLRAWLGRGNRTRCNACGELLAWDDAMIEGFTATGTVFWFHTRCFYLWAGEQEALLPQPA